MRTAYELISKLVEPWVRGKQSLRIVYYHKVQNVGGSSYYFSNSMSLDVFKKQLDYFQKKHEIISLTEAYTKAVNGDSLSGYLVVCFDDGFSDNYHYAFPELKKRGIKATHFMMSNVLDNRDLMWRNKLIALDRLASNKADIALKFEHEFGKVIPMDMSFVEFSNHWEMATKEVYANFMWEASQLGSLRDFLEKEKPYMTIPMVNEMLEDGQELGIHTASHPFCNKLTYSELVNEILVAKQYFYDQFGIDTGYFAYPFGERASRDFENRLLNDCDLKLLLGINDQLKNTALKYDWERVGMEKGYARSLMAFNAKSLYNNSKSSPGLFSN